MLEWIVEVRDPDRIRVGQLVAHDLTDFLCTPRANTLGSWSVKLPDSILDDDGRRVPHALCAALRTQSAGIVVTAPNGDVVLSGSMEYAEQLQDTDDPEGTWTITGVSDLLELAKPVAFPDPATADVNAQTRANDTRTDVAERLLRTYVNLNIGPAAVPARRVAGLTIAADEGRGPILTKSPRFQNLLELCTEIGVGSDLLFDIRQDGDGLEFVVLDRVDASALLRWDVANNQLAQAKYGYAGPRYTRVFVAGQDQGVDRTIIEVTTPASLAAEAIWGRRELFLDQRQTNDPDELWQAGLEALAEGGQLITSLEVVPSEDMAAGFMSDWFVGTLVTVVVGGQEVVAPIAEVPISITRDGVFVGAVVGDPVGFDWESILTAKQASVEKRVSLIERNLDVPSELYSAQQVDDLIAAHQVARRNRVINGDCRVSQMNVSSGEYFALNSYGFDMWRTMTTTQINLASNPTGLINGAPSALAWVGFSAGTVTLLSGLTIPGLAGVTTAVRGTASAGATNGMYLHQSQGKGIRVVAGQTYTMSMWVRAGVNITLPLAIQWANAAGSGISATVGTPVALAANVWQQISVTGVAPAGAAAGGPYAYRTSGTWAAGNTLDATGVLVELGAAVNAYYPPPTLTFTRAPQGQLVSFTGSNIGQVIERANIVAGDYIAQHAGTAPIRVYNEGSAPPAFSPSGMVAVSLSGTANVIVEFEGSTAARTFGEVQLELGTVATPFERLPIGEQLTLCQRYYWRFANTNAPGGASYQVGAFSAYTSTSFYGTLHFPVDMRVPPTVTPSSPNAILAQYAAVASISSSLTFDLVSTRSCRVQMTSPGSLTAGYGGWYELRAGYHIEADARL
jgi:hypothetical protein